jgi:hypothetical protein
MALTIELVRERAPSSLSEAALNSLLAETYSHIAHVIGEPGPLTEVLTADAGDVLLLSRPAASITSVLENNTELDASDYKLGTTRLLLRLSTGGHPSLRWRGRPEITYEVLNDVAERDRIAMALIKLEMNFNPGLASQRIGQWAESYSQGVDVAAEREAIFASYHGSGGFI